MPRARVSELIRSRHGAIPGVGCPAAAVLARIDDYYADRSNEEDSVLTSLVLRLAEPAPKDPKVTRQLRSYKELDRRWHDWASVVAVCTDVADRLLDLVEQEQR